MRTDPSPNTPISLGQFVNIPNAMFAEVDAFAKPAR